MDNLDELIALTSKLIRFKSTSSRPEEIDSCAAYIHAWLKANGIASQLTHNNDVPCVSVLPKDDAVPVLLMAHFDVVEAEDDSLFEPKVENGSLWGRGSLDDKYGVAMSMLRYRDSLREVVAQGGTQADMPFGLLLTGDEESGGHDGARTLLKQVRTNFCIALDGGAPDTVIIKQKGILNLRLTAQGKAAHGARPWRGENAADLLIEDYLRLKELFPDKGGEHWHRTLNLGALHTGSNSLNQVPAEAHALFDVRYTEEDTPDELVKAMRATIRGTLEVLVQEPQLIPYETPYLGLLLEQHPDMHPGCAHGASDARFLTERGIPGVVWGAWGSSTAHSLAEHVTLESLNTLSRRLQSFLQAIPINIPIKN
ncbi:M20 family metallopeptidase [Desulfovibrio ferrophilus]|uniref:Peptidase M20 n=1 Tax=Desulfovibrio ferrophilus TaxID=241368 RepID=A0A2Z6AZD1_9BACT|nr:M20 family metallopeptidase [Desulfovibrio ferrophilus]BBD08599.1 peptidase M20 [Desulfovibrio ferrophilus]